MPIVIPAMLRCDGCERSTMGEVVMHSKHNLELRHEDAWFVEQGGMIDYGEGLWTKVWCSKECKERR